MRRVDGSRSLLETSLSLIEGREGLKWLYKKNRFMLLFAILLGLYVYIVGMHPHYGWSQRLIHYIFTPNVPDQAEIPISLPPKVQEEMDELSLIHIGGNSANEIMLAFEKQNYDLSSVRKNKAQVPLVMLRNIPDDFASISEVKRKKAVFLQSILPLILLSNYEITELRKKLLAIQDKGLSVDKLPPWALAMFERYDVEIGEWDILLRRVDGVPVSLALAQAAIESGWGSSRFAQEGNALFGQWIWSNDDAGLVPEARGDGQSHSIRKFDSPLDAVLAYIHNLNIHYAYKDFRIARAALRKQNLELNLHQSLLDGLHAYSEKGGEYLELINAIITQNNLTDFDQAKLNL